MEYKDFGIRLINCPEKVNDLIVFKMHLYLGCLVSQSRLKNNVFCIDTKTVMESLNICKKTYITNALEYLKSIDYRYAYYKRKIKATNKWETEIRKCKIVDDYSKTKGNIIVRLNDDYIKLLGYKIKDCKDIQFVELPDKLLALDIKNYKHSLFLGFKILLDSKINYNNEKRKNIISIKELTRHCPLLPKYEDLGEQKQVSRRIIQPFENNMNYLADELNFRWQYRSDVNSYGTFIKNSIVFEFNN